jgi:hypothetical protein
MTLPMVVVAAVSAFAAERTRPPNLTYRIPGRPGLNAVIGAPQIPPKLLQASRPYFCWYTDYCYDA